MQTLILWVGFAGAWLLFAGPLYQAALELKEENIEFDRTKAVEGLRKPRPISVWWWLLPPIKLWLEHRRSNEIRRAFVRSLPPETMETLLSFLNKATGWSYVGLGGFCIALKETYELTEHMHWNLVIYIPLVVVLGLACIINVIMRVRRSKTILDRLHQ